MKPNYLLAACVVFLSAFLLFQIQPIIAKVILPLHGGTAAVWTTCMMFFQIVLLAGYAWAHYCQSVNGRAVHLALLFGAVVCAFWLLPHTTQLIKHPQLSPNLGMNTEIVLTLAVYIGLPFFVLASTGPLVQSWLGNSVSKNKTYRLYAYSNAGSMLGLLTYPFVIERLCGVTQQIRLWTVGFALFSTGLTIIAIKSRRQKIERKFDHTETHLSATQPPGKAKSLVAKGIFWVILAMTSSMLLLSTTNYLCQEVTSSPLLWIVPLSLYLLSFIICFDSPRWYVPQVWTITFGAAAVSAIILIHLGSFAGLGLQVAGLSLVCFSGSMVCHGELAATKPNTERLTAFYLYVALGGALGGVFVSLAAPVLFVGFYEFQISLILTGGLSLLNVARHHFYSEQRIELRGLRLSTVAVIATLLLSLLSSFWSLSEEFKIWKSDGVIFYGRNEYGLTRVVVNANTRNFISGRTVHGTQLIDPDLELKRAGYYREGSGVEVAFEGMRAIDEEGELKIAVLGLGAGAMATWFNEGDEVDFYEINPMVVEVAKNYFSFLDKSPGKKEVFVGDGRIELQRRKRSESGKYDLIFMDAFASDSIPVHLLTEEAVGVYLENLNRKGVIVFHITNHFVDLRPIVLHHIDQQQLRYTYIQHQPASDSAKTEWIIVGREPSFFESDVVRPLTVELTGVRPIGWTDDFASVVSQLKWSASIDWEAVKSANSNVKSNDKTN
jgi:hypothetical protein